jgi:hypothetical protein
MMNMKGLCLSIGFLFLASQPFARSGIVVDIQTFTVTVTSSNQVYTFAQIGVQDGSNVFPYVLPIIDANGSEFPGAKIHLAICQQALATQAPATLIAVGEASGYAGDVWALGASDLFPNGYSKPRLKKVTLAN